MTTTTTTLTQPAPAETRAAARTAIAIDGAGKDYTAMDGRLVHGLSPVTLTIAAGSFVSLVGRSGCGK